MATVVPKFSVTFVIGGKEITLSSSDLPDSLLDEIKQLKDQGNRQAAQDKFKAALKEALSFSLPEGQTVSVKMQELLDWLSGKGFDVSAADLFDDTVITITAFSISAKGEFTIAFEIELNLDISDDLKDIIDVKEIGIGFSYKKDSAAGTTPAPATV
ncbi:MAG: hypothetical protein F6J95_025510 [Leptolyngbya sp. SIO1E4]|nr:hypothetical protein [Leptolyngbya sp. SIO1E4]